MSSNDGTQPELFQSLRALSMIIISQQDLPDAHNMLTFRRATGVIVHQAEVTHWCLYLSVGKFRHRVPGDQ